MQSSLRLLVASLTLLPAGAHAAEPQSADARCRAFVSDVFRSPDMIVTPVGDTQCDIRQARIAVAMTAWTIDRIVITGLPPDVSKIPPRVHIEAHGLRFSASTTPMAKFLTGLNARPLEILIDWSTHPDDTADLQVSVVSANAGATILNAAVTHPPADLGLSASPSLRELRLHMDGRGFFEMFVATVTAGFLGAQGNDPAARFADLVHQADLVSRQALAGPITSDSSRDAVAAFLASLPHPDKPFDLVVSFPEPVELGPLLDPSHMLDTLAPGSVIASYAN